MSKASRSFQRFPRHCVAGVGIHFPINLRINRWRTRLSQPVAIVTGASRGIGLATAQRLAKRGYAVVGVARNEDHLWRAVEGLKRLGAPAAAVAVDVSTTAGCTAVIDAAISSFGRIDVVINNAGAAPLAKIPAFTDEMLDEALSANIVAVLRMTRAAWPHLAETKGTIVNLSSLGSVDPFPGFAVYGACKTWVNAFTAAAAKEGKAAGIRVFAVAPGAVETEMLRANFPNFPAAQTLSPDDVAAEIEKCLDAAANERNGQTIFVRK